MTLEAMQPLAAELGVAEQLEAPGDGESDADELADHAGYDATFLPGWEIPLPQVDSIRRLLAARASARYDDD